jgi:hypothetical protein
VCAASGFSLKWFTGDPRGAVQAAEQDAISDLSNLRRLFGDFKEPIKKFVEFYYNVNVEEVTPLILQLADEAEQKELEDGETPDEETKKDSKEKPKDE